MENCSQWMDGLDWGTLVFQMKLQIMDWNVWLYWYIHHATEKNFKMLDAFSWMAIHFCWTVFPLCVNSRENTMNWNAKQEWTVCSKPSKNKQWSISYSKWCSISGTMWWYQYEDCFALLCNMCMSWFRYKCITFVWITISVNTKPNHIWYF